MTQADDELVLRECRRAGVADLDGDDIGRGDQTLAHEEADGELFIVAARAHGDGDVGRDLARAGDADRQRLLARQQILALVGPARADRHDPAGRARAIGTVASFGARRHGASVSRTVARVAATRPPARTRAAREARAGRSAGPRIEKVSGMPETLRCCAFAPALRRGGGRSSRCSKRACRSWGGRGPMPPCRSWSRSR